MENNKSKRNKLILVVLLVIGIISITIGVTYSFFNYTRKGQANSISTGRIYFNSTQNGILQLTNIFPVKSTDLNENTLDSVEVNIIGDTTYTDGEEFLITIVDVNNEVNGKKIPLNYIASYTANTNEVIGTSSNDYFTERESKDASIYSLTARGQVEENKQVLVGYIASGATGINGKLTIKAYIDAEKVAISDTYPEGFVFQSANIEKIRPSRLADIQFPKFYNGTTEDWVNGRVVFTTDEWNSFQNSGTPISFKIKAESNEGIWVEEPSKGIESCPDCKFTYFVADPSDESTWKWATWNNQSQTPTQITTGLYNNYEKLINATGKNYFLGVKLNNNNEVTNAYACGVKDNIPFCIEGYSDTSKYSANETLLQGENLYNNTCTVKSGVTQCGPWDNSGSLSALTTSNNGYVIVGVDVDDNGEGGDSCIVYPFGFFGCFESGTGEVADGTIESCPDCKFIYTTNTLWTTWNTENAIPTEITSGLYDNYEELIETTGKNYFLGVKLNNNNEVTNAYACGVKDNVPFCIEGTIDGSKYNVNLSLINGSRLWNNTCTEETGKGTTSTTCGFEDGSSFSAYSHSDGTVGVGIDVDNDCTVVSWGIFFCDESHGG